MANSQRNAGATGATNWPMISCSTVVALVAFTFIFFGGDAGAVVSVNSKDNFLNVSVVSVNDFERPFEFNYGEALEKCILFFENQRSGKLPDSQRATWRGDSGLADGNDVGVDLTGGYYDAGDNVKFGVPLAFTATVLAWGMVEYRPQLTSAGQIWHAEEALRWITDYLLKAVTGPTELWVQVGDADADHSCWERPEDMDTSRKSFKIDELHPGTEPAAETAAALAAASKVFKDTDPTYSDRLLEQAYIMFNFADQHRGSYDAACPHYCSFTGFYDELLWAAAWLFEASENQYYLDYVINHAYLSTPANVFSWDDKFAGVQILLAKHYLQGNSALYIYKAHADKFVCATLPSNPQRVVQFTPGGLLFIQDNNNIQYVTTTAFLLAIYSDFLTFYGTKVYCAETHFEPHVLYSFAKSQVDYLLGSNPLGISYMVGYSDYYPRQSHHRGASIVSQHEDPHRITCYEGYSNWYNKDERNPNILTGALLGPNQFDQFSDKRTDFVHLETPTYVNAPFVGLLARIMST